MDIGSNIFFPSGILFSERSINELSSNKAMPDFFAFIRTSGTHVIIPGSSPPKTTKINPSSLPTFLKALNIFVGIEIISPAFNTISSFPSAPQ